MSGLEGLAAVSFAGNVFQFIDFAITLYERIDQLSLGTTAAGEVPRKLETLANRLSSTAETLKALDQEGLTAVENDKKTLEACTARTKDLDERLKRFTVKNSKPGTSNLQKGAKKAERVWKALNSVHADDEIEDLQRSLDRLLDLVSLQHQLRMAIKNDRNHEDIVKQLESLCLEVAAKSTVMREPDVPITILPFTRNHNFVGRVEFLDDIDRKFSSGQRSVALCGLGGVGKSQIALEYSFRFREKSPQASIFWVYTSAGVNFEQSYNKIATCCGVPGREDTEKNMMQLVTDWLENHYELEWLMIIDNVDSIETFFKIEIHGKKLIDYVPQSANGSVLYTSRNRDIGVDLTQDYDPIMITSMNLEEAQHLLGKDLIGRSTSEDRRDLLEELDYLPLAINQAVAYMTKRRISIKEYLVLFRKSDSNKVRLLKHEFSDNGRETRRMESLATTFIVSFEYLRAEHPNAADLLSIMSYFDRQSIPRSCLQSENTDPLDFEDSIEFLIAFSFVTGDDQVRGENGDNDGFNAGFKGYSYSMHRLVQLATRQWLKENKTGKEDAFASQAIQRFQTQMLAMKPYRRDYALLQYSPRVMPYTRMSMRGSTIPWRTHHQTLLAVQLHHPTTETRLAQASLHFESAILASSDRNDTSAVAHATESLEIRSEILGREDLETCRSAALVASFRDIKHKSVPGRRYDEDLHTVREGWGNEDDEIRGLLRQALDGFYQHFELAVEDATNCFLGLVNLYLLRKVGEDEQAESLVRELLERMETLPDRGEEVSGQVHLIIYQVGQRIFPCGALKQFWEVCLNRLEERYHHLAGRF